MGYFNGPKTDESVDMTGKVVIITGSSSGIGQYAAKIISKNGAHVILAVRSEEKGNKVKEEILNEFPKAKLSIMFIDVSDLNSVNEFAEDFMKLNLPLHALVANAGCANYLDDKIRNLDPMFVTNYLGHYLLITKLLPLMKASGTESDPARIVFVSSVAHKEAPSLYLSPTNLEDYIYTPRIVSKSTELLTQLTYYGFSKLASCMHCYHLSVKLKEEGVNTVVVSALHPGNVNTPIWNQIAGGIPLHERILVYPIVKVWSWAFMKDQEHGAQPIIKAVCSSEMAKLSGVYLDMMELGEFSPLVFEDDLRNALIDLSDKLIHDYLIATNYNQN